MAKQLNILSSGQVVPTALHTEVQRSYLEYAMSVIVGRALPDVRDGLKPVHRRILYAMHELGLTPDRPYRKCARVVGDVLGKYHPHGDQAVYDALVRMVQEFSSRYPVLAGHGNFGSVDNDPPAAMRYTETRLASIGNEALLAEIGEATVDFIGNFDNSQQEPIVLPAQLPFLLLNGCSGIAVGMATNIPPHHLGEIVDGLIALIDRPTLSDEHLLEIIPGPDFPTGGEIIGTEGIRDAYLTGRGSIPVRGIAQFEEIPGGRGRQRRSAIVVTELPFQVNKAAWIEKLADLVNQGRIQGISDIRDESDRDGMRVVIELKREANAQKILNRMYKMTPLQTNFGTIMLALVDGQPRQMPLREVLQQFLEFREETLTRQYNHELERVETRIHLVHGLLSALANLDEVIDILRSAPDGTTAKLTLQNQFDFSDRQADAILSMPLRRLTGLERQNLQTEYESLNRRREDLRTLLGDRRELLKALKKELRALKRQHGDERRTRIQSEAERAEESRRIEDLQAEEAIQAEEVVLEFTSRGYVQRRSPRAFEKAQEQRDVQEATLHDYEDIPLQAIAATTQQTLLVLTRTGKAFTVNVADIPPTPRNSRGTAFISLLPPSAQEAQEAIAFYDILPEHDAPDLVLLTQQGRIKRLAVSELVSSTSRGLTALKLKEGDELKYVTFARPDDQMVVGTSGGRVLRFAVDDEQLPVMTRTAQGNTAVRMRKGETVVGCVAVRPDQEVVLFTQHGYFKRLAVKDLRLAHRGDLGLQAMRFALKTDALVGLAPLQPGLHLTLLSDAQRAAQFSAGTVAKARATETGDRLLKANRGEKMIEGVVSLGLLDAASQQES
ncbi:MAG: DNA gyrase subunit A [Leptolyngbya sp. DLM2.Bin15]|nr:MAG: DNA gyrase subunit A [Leptolyngbya sp. DLM2.Bin15]